MEVLILVVFVALVVGAVVWNRRNAAAAEEGVLFHVDESPDMVAQAIERAYCQGAKAKMKTAIGRVTVVKQGPRVFRTETKVGDFGGIAVEESRGTGSGCAVRAQTTTLYVGSHPMSHGRSGGIWGLASGLTHVIYKMLGITPNASRMKRFQRRIESQIAKQLRKGARA